MHGSYYILCLCYMCSQQPALNNNACIHALGDMMLIFVVVDRTSGDDANKIILCLVVPSMILQQLQRSFKVCPLYGPPPFTFVKKYSPLQYIFLVFFVGWLFNQKRSFFSSPPVLHTLSSLIFSAQVGLLLLGICVLLHV